MFWDKVARFYDFFEKAYNGKANDAYFRKSVKRLLMATVYFVMAKTKFGELAATDHCKNAPEEMQFLDEKFNAFLGDARSQMPVWEQLRREAQEQSKCI